MSDTKSEARKPRTANTREKEERDISWAPPSSLDAPPAEDGYHHRWIRIEMLGQNDAKNVSKRMREGYEPVPASDYPDFDLPVIADGKYEGMFGTGGLILCRIDDRIVKARNKYFRDQTRGQMEAVDDNMMRVNQPGTHGMEIGRPNRKTRTTFGGPRNEDE